MKACHEIINIADLRAESMKSAINHISPLFPVNAPGIQVMHENDFLWVELLIGRFGKLQDLIGTKIIDN